MCRKVADSSDNERSTDPDVANERSTDPDVAVLLFPVRDLTRKIIRKELDQHPVSMECKAHLLQGFIMSNFYLLFVSVCK